MRVSSICLLLSVLCLGCNRAEEARRKATKDNLKQIGEALKNYDKTHKSQVSEFTHVIAAETEYYTTGPQQGRPPDDRQLAKINLPAWDVLSYPSQSLVLR